MEEVRDENGETKHRKGSKGMQRPLEVGLNEGIGLDYLSGSLPTWGSF